MLERCSGNAAGCWSRADGSASTSPAEVGPEAPIPVAVTHRANPQSCRTGWIHDCGPLFSSANEVCAGVRDSAQMGQR
jgi:hypothetical protein